MRALAAAPEILLQVVMDPGGGHGRSHLNTQDPDDLQAIFIFARDAIRRFLVARLGNDADADDVLQEVYLKLGRATIVGEMRDPQAYLFRVALNLASDYRRQRRRAQARDSAWAVTQNLVAGGEAISDAPSADAVYASRQQMAQVRSALNELSPQCRQVFIMHKFAGLPHSEITSRLGITRSTVEKHMHTALRHLVERLGRNLNATMGNRP